MSSTLNLLNAFERSVKCESDTVFINSWLARLVDPDRTTVLPSMVLESGNLFSNPMLEMPKAFKTKVNDLKDDVKHVPAEYKQQAKHIVKLYEDRNIGNFATAENAISKLANPRYIKSGKADEIDAGIVAKYDTALPTTGRLERERLAWEAKKEAKRIATQETAYDITLF